MSEEGPRWDAIDDGELILDGCKGQRVIMENFDDIQCTLANREPGILPADRRRLAAVALILRKGTAGLEMLFIERARHAGDPWSGDLGFPGGKIEADDADPRFAAERETREEIGLDLRCARYLGRLDEIVGATLPVRVTCFVYGVVGEVEPHLNEEVHDAFWVRLADLVDPGRHVEVPVRFTGKILRRPAIRLPQPGIPVLWGLTYRLVTQFLKVLHEPICSGDRHHP